MMISPYLFLRLFRPRLLGGLIVLVLWGESHRLNAEEIQFNTDVLDLKDSTNIDLQQFSRGGYIMPGEYSMAVKINNQALPEQTILFYPPENDPKGSEACISPALVEQLGLKPQAQTHLGWWHQGQCLQVNSLEGMEAHGDLATSTLSISIPQAYLEYVAANWEPSSRWDNGIPGILLDYNLNAQVQQQRQQPGNQNQDLSGNGILGVNQGSWRLRAGWQSQLQHQTGREQPTQRSWDWERLYAYRAILRLKARLMLGEQFLDSSLFDSFRFTGISLATDDRMLPPNLRGYAPEVRGIARTNAKVVISQQGRVLYETLVAAGPFRIQDINSAVSGQLDVRVEEQDGSVQSFSISTANIPYLTRAGTVRYKLVAGRPSDINRHTSDPTFTAGEFSWGVSNGWSLYGGAIMGEQYNTLALGLGRDLMILGALAFDVTQSRVRVEDPEKTLSGGSYRLSYSKRFDDYDSEVEFAGYRFSEKNFMSMAEFLDMRNNGGVRSQNSKEMYTVSLTKQFRESGVSAYLNYEHRTYWDRADNDRYSLSLARYFNLGRFKNLSLSLNAYRHQYNKINDDGAYLSLSIPWGDRGSLGYSSMFTRQNNDQRVSYADRINGDDNYQITTGADRDGLKLAGFYNHNGDSALVNLSASYARNSYTALGMSLRGGATLTQEGAALHRVSSLGGSRLLLDTDGVAGIPIQGNNTTATWSNRFGKAVVADINSYYRDSVSIDLNQLPDNAEAVSSVVQATLTEGAIGYRRFDVVSGEKVMAVIRLADGSTPPFGATVVNQREKTVGMISDEGNVYLSGITEGETMTAHWSGSKQCVLSLPKKLPANRMAELLLPCQRLTTSKAG
ncbi:outer membrane usher protein [Serratia sp. D1N4]